MVTWCSNGKSNCVFSSNFSEAKKKQKKSKKEKTSKKKTKMKAAGIASLPVLQRRTPPWTGNYLN